MQILLAAKLLFMSDKSRESDPVSDFIRHLIDRWEASGGKLKALAAEAGLAQSMPSQIKARTSNASFYSASKLAKPFGYADLPDLVNAAWTWSRGDRQVIPPSTSEAPRVEAMRLAAQYAVTSEQMQRALQRYPSPDYDHKDVLWWLSRFHEERTLDAERAAEVKAQSHRETYATKVRTSYQEQLQELREPAKAPQSHKSGKKAG